MSVHVSLEDYSAAVYYNAALRHHAAHPGAVMRLYQLEEPVGLIDLDTERGAEEDIGWVSLLYLKDSYRNKGYGIQLLGRAEMLYEDLGRNRLQLQVSEKNGIARAFYIREGFRTVGETDTTDGKLLLMEKNLGDHNDE
jgi:probable phosphoglycerate mutase